MNEPGQSRLRHDSTADKGRWTSGGGVRGMRIWVAITVGAIILFAVVAAVTVAQNTKKSLPPAPATVLLHQQPATTVHVSM